MKRESVGKTLLSPLTLGAPCSYHLEGDRIVGRLFGLIPICNVHLGAVHYLRLASRREVSPAYFMLNWPRFLLTSHRATRPVYILRTRKGHKLFLLMEGGAHFRLRQAIGRHSDRKTHALAA